MHTRKKVGLFTLLACLGGCASMFLHGGRLSDGTEQSRIVAKYQVQSCANTATGEPMQGTTTQEYWLINDRQGIALAEMDRTGSGTVITNHWQEPDGDHFFAWVQSSGWEYVVPPDHSQPASRIVYTQLATGSVGGVTKPTSAPNAKCVMVPLGTAAAAPTAAPTVAPVATPAATAAPTQPPATPTAPAPTVAPAPTPTPGAGAVCVPACRQSYVCVHGQCVSACNPPCPAGQRCNANGDCEAPKATPGPR